MKLNSETFEVLKNFSTINQGIMFEPGNVIKTISDRKNILATAVLNQEIDGKACVYDISRLLATVDVMDNPEVQFTKDRFIMENDRSKVEYTYASENMIITPPKDKSIEMNDIKGTFKLTWKAIQNITKAAGVLNLPDIHIWSKDGSVHLSAEDKKNPTADKYQVDVETDDAQSDFSVYLKVEYLKLIPMDYTVKVTNRIVHFENERVEYWIAADA